MVISESYFNFVPKLITKSTTTMSHRPTTRTKTRPHVGGKEMQMQEREREQAAYQAKRRKMQPWSGKDEPQFKTVEPWTGKE